MSDPANHNKSDYNFWEAQKSMTALVKIVQRFPEVYSCTVDTYRSRFHLDKAWQKVYEAVTTELDIECSLDELKGKWKGIRSSFGRYVNKCNQCAADGTEPPRKYYLRDCLDFLLPHMKAKSGEPKFAQDSFVTYYEDDDTNESDAALHTWTDPSPEVIDMIKAEPEIIDENNSFIEPKAEVITWDHPSPEVNDVIKAEPVVIDDENSIPEVEQAEPPLKKIRTDEKTSNDGENNDLQFFKCILPDIAHFTPQEKRKLKIGLLKLIDDIENERK